MKVKAIITLIVGRGVEVPPNEVADVSESEGKRLIELGFAEEVSKQTVPRSRNNTPSKPILIPPQEMEDEEEPEDNENLEDGESDDSDEENSGQPV